MRTMTRNSIDKVKVYPRVVVNSIPGKDDLNPVRDKLNVVIILLSIAKSSVMRVMVTMRMLSTG